MSRMFELMYLLRFTPWERKQPPPELVTLVEGPGALSPGRALDLGCGTGAQSVYLAARGWDVTGVDIVGRAIKAARRRATKARQQVRFIEGDVTAIGALGVGGGYSLVLDVGCLHTIPRARRRAYAEGIVAATGPGARFLSMAFRPATRGPLPPGVDATELAALFPGWTLEWERRDPGDSGIGPMKNAGATWRLLTRDAASNLAAESRINSG